MKIPLFLSLKDKTEMYIILTTFMVTNKCFSLPRGTKTFSEGLQR
jgi:hypothetical protein